MVIVRSKCCDMKKKMFRHFRTEHFFFSADYNVSEKFWYVSSLVKSVFGKSVFWVKGCGMGTLFLFPIVLGKM